MTRPGLSAGSAAPPMTSKIPADIRQFIADYIDSVSLLDVLLLLRAAPDKRWSAAEVGRALVTGEAPAAGHLARLRDRRLVVETAGEYRYAPPAEHEATVDALAECYARRRHTVIGIIFGAPEQPATALAEAFLFRRRQR